MYSVKSIIIEYNITQSGHQWSQIEFPLNGLNFNATSFSNRIACTLPYINDCLEHSSVREIE